MSERTEVLRVGFLSWRDIFRLTLNLLVLVLQPLTILALSNEALAQVNVDQQDTRQAVNNSGDSKNKANQLAAALEPSILEEINRVRTNPQGYAQWLEEQRQYYDGIWLKLPGEKPIRTNKGRKALEEAIAFLKEQSPLPPLAISEQTADIATSELENFATANNIQYFSYGRKTASGIVMGLVVDDLFPDRRRRDSLLSPNAEDTGVVCKPDPRYAKVCAIAYSDSTTTNVAASSSESEATPESNTVAEIPEIIIPPATTQNTETPIAPKEEAETNIPIPENTENENSESSDLATLPVPPVPQAPPQPTIVNQEPATEETETTADLEEDGSDQSAAPTKTDPEVDSEPTAISEPESEEDQPAEEEVIAQSDNDLPFTKVERGALEKGDRVISEDGSLYDFYPLEGNAGESYTIYLESDEFDAFVALVDSNGNTIKENDDISEENSNSRIRVTLPEDGTYNIIVNTYDEKGTGKYILTLSR
ncbi:MAG: PPC domain-containing protein [Cyanobacteria bacterium P01_G01_bin.39]